METGLGDDVNFDGGVATRIVDRSSLDLGDCHDCGFLQRGKELAIKVVGERIEDSGIIHTFWIL